MDGKKNRVNIMKNIKCSICNSKMRLVQYGNYDGNEWKKEIKSKYKGRHYPDNTCLENIYPEQYIGKRIRYKKIKTNSIYRMIFKCSKNTCNELKIIQARNKALVLKQINLINKKEKTKC